jgi:hypothetical protein
MMFSVNGPAKIGEGCAYHTVWIGPGNTFNADSAENILGPPEIAPGIAPEIAPEVPRK